MSNPKNYNGLRNQFGNMAGVPNLAGLQKPTPEQIQQFIGQRIEAMSVEMYMRGAVELMRLGDPEERWPGAENYHDLQEQCELAAMCYFEAKGTITRPEPAPEDDQPASETDSPLSAP